MNKRTIIAMAAALAATFAKADINDSGSQVEMFLVGGQSNTDGRLGADTLPDYLSKNEYALVSAHSPLATAMLGKFVKYAPTSGDLGQPSQWAYDAELYYHIANALGKVFYVAKTSYGGTSINPAVGCSPSSHANEWLPGYGAGYHWSADAAFLEATVSAGKILKNGDTKYDGQSMLEAWIDNIDAAIDALVDDGKTPVVKAIVWHQGESDRNDSGYAAKLTAVVNHVRSYLATKLNDESYLTLPFFCGNIPRKSSLYTANIDRQFAAIEDDADNNMHVVDIYDLTMKSDNKHFDAASAVVFGKRLFNRMIDEGVISGEIVSVAECVRSPDFGGEQVVNNTTTWTWNDASGDLATALANLDGIYFHAASSDSRKIQTNGTGIQTLNWTFGDTTPTTVNKGAYCTGYADNGSNLSTTSTAGENNKANYMAAVNVGRSGKFELFFWAREANNGTAKLYFNGTEVSSATVATAGEVLHLMAENDGKGTYYFGFGGKGAIVGVRFVPDEEMPTVALSVGESGYGTFGNLYEANFVLPEGVKAYAISPVDGYPTLLSMTEVGALNLGDAVVVKGAPGTYTLESGEGAKYDGENLMVIQRETGVVAATSGSDFINFMQTSQDGKLVFTKSDGTQTLEAGKAFFSITEGDEHSQHNTLSCRNTGDTSKFTWTGKGDDTLWTTLDNWAWPDGETPLNVPGGGATVTFDDEATVTFDSETASGGQTFVLNANVTLSSDGNKERTVYMIGVSGNGCLVLGKNIDIRTLTYKTLEIANDIVVQDGATAYITARGNGAVLRLTGSVSGGGWLKARPTNSGSKVIIAGDMSGFTGTLTTDTTGTTTITGNTGDDGVAVSAAGPDKAAAMFTIARPSGVTDEVVTEAAYEGYFTKSAVAKEGASGVFVVTVALDADVVVPHDTFATIDASEIVDGDVVAFTNAKPGLYYSIVGGTDVNAIESEGERILATGTTVTPVKPELGEANSKFYRLRVSRNEE